MIEIKQPPSGAKEDLGDYVTVPVPKEERIGWGMQGIIWAGNSFCLPAFTVGGALAAAMGTASFLAAVFLGTLVVALLGVLTGLIGARTHLPSGFNARFTLGTAGGKLFSLILAVSLFGWFGFQCQGFADSVVSTLTMFGLPSSSPVLWTIVGGLLMILTVAAGFNAITLLSALGVPLLIALALAAAAVTTSQADPAVLKAASDAAAGGMSLPMGITLVVGSYVTGSCITADVSRFSKAPSDTFWGCFWGHMAAFPLALALGGFFQYAYGISGICDVMFSYCGMAMFVPFVLVVSIWSINNFNLYCAVLGILNTLDGFVKLPQWMITLMIGAVSTLLGALGILEAYTPFLNLLGVLIPPVAAVIIADYYLYERSSGLYDYKNIGRLKNVRCGPCLSAAAGIAVGLMCNYANLPVLDALCRSVPACIAAMLSSVIVLILYNTAARSRKASAV